MLVADLRPVLDHVHEGHGVAPAEVEVLLEPVDDHACLRRLVVATPARQRDQLGRGLERVEVAESGTMEGWSRESRSNSTT
jgi:hypothetical protein